MKNFKRLIKEAYLGNPLNEDYNRMHNVELNALYKNKLGVKDTKGLTRDDLIRGLKFHDASMDEYGKPFLELSIAQKQELLSYMNKETEKQFQTDYERRRRGDYSDDMEDGMTDYQRRRMDEELKLGVKYELPTGETGYIMTGGSKDPKDWKFSANKESYLSVKDKLKPTKKQPGKYDGAYDMGMGKGHHIDEGEYRIEYEDEDDNRNYIKIKASSEEEAEQKSSGLDGFRTLKSIELVDEGTCGYGEDGKIGKIPAGAHLQKEESEGDKEIRALEKKAEKYPKGDSRREVIQKKIGDLKSDKDYALPGSKADKKFSDMSDKEIDDEVRRLLKRNFMEEEIETSLTPNEIGDEAVERESNSTAYESLKEALKNRLK